MNMPKNRDEVHDHTGTLYIVPTPIGNLGDMSARAIDVLGSVDVVACEDTRHSRKLMHAFGLDKRLVSYHHHNRYDKSRQLVDDLKGGTDIAYISDAGMPSISDPGAELVRAAAEEGITVVVLPGANAALTALVGSGLETEHFLFYGFLPRQRRKRQAALQQLKPLPFTCIFYEAPHRLSESLQDMLDVWGNRRAALAREITKKHETYLRGTLQDILFWSEQGEVRGECCLIVEGLTSEQADDSATAVQESLWWTDMDMFDHVHYFVERGWNVKDAARHVAMERGLGKREVYQHYHEQRHASDV